jgi:membrane-associated protease RseP (regulator of RpoE activity)
MPATPAAYFEFMGGTIGGTFEMIGQLPQQAGHAFQAITGQEERDSNGAVSVVGITKVAGDIAIDSEGDWSSTIAIWLLTLASLNIALFAFNMIPVLPLDGGHIAAAIYGKVKQLWFKLTKRGTPRPVDLALLAPLTMVGWVALTIMGLLFVVADIVAPVSI